MLEGDDGTRTGDRVTEVWAWVSIDPKDDCEGVIAGYIGNVAIPLIGADRERVESYRPTAQEAVERFGVTIKLVRFHQREEVEVLAGDN